MLNLAKIAARNLVRHRRRTILTASLITIGVVSVVVFIAASGSFKSIIVGQITDSMLGHMQVHRKGYVASIDNLPLTMNLRPPAVERIEAALEQTPQVASYSKRVKFGAVFSTFTETTSVRVNGVSPEAEFKTVPLLPSRILEGEKELRPGEILVPELVARGMQTKVGDTVVLIATNQDGSVNGKQFTVGGILESVTGPGGRDSYVHIDDAREVLRMEEMGVSEIAVRLNDFGDLHATHAGLVGLLGNEVNKQGKPAFEIHTWEGLSPFHNIARMIDVMTLAIKVVLMGIVLVSITNVMLMAVYERIREIGTISAMGTRPGKVLAMFLTEGLLLGVFGAIAGAVLSLAAVGAMNLAQVRFDFGRQSGVLLSPSIQATDLLAVSAIVVAVAVIASLQPAFKASRMEPIEALRHV